MLTLNRPRPVSAASYTPAKLQTLIASLNALQADVNGSAAAALESLSRQAGTVRARLEECSLELPSADAVRDSFQRQWEERMLQARLEELPRDEPRAENERKRLQARLDEIHAQSAAGGATEADLNGWPDEAASLRRRLKEIWTEQLREETIRATMQARLESAKDYLRRGEINHFAAAIATVFRPVPLKAGKRLLFASSQWQWLIGWQRADLGEWGYQTAIMEHDSDYVLTLLQQRQPALLQLLRDALAAAAP